MQISQDLIAQLGLLVAAALTVITLSYAFRDNPIFRAVLYLFIGVAAGYAAAIAVQDVILPHLVYPILDEFSGAPTLTILELAIRGALVLLLLTKLSPRTARLGSPVTALLAGVGAALAIGGAVQGTLIPQIGVAAGSFDVRSLNSALQSGYYGEGLQIIFQGLILLLATVSSLAFFHFGARSRGNQQPQRQPVVDYLSRVGAIFIGIALATLFSSVLQAALGALTERLAFLQDVVKIWLGLP